MPNIQHRTQRSRLIARRSSIGTLFLGLLFLIVAPTLSAQWCPEAFTPCDTTDPLSPCYSPPDPDPKCEPVECEKCTKSPCYAGTGVYVTNALDIATPTTGLQLMGARHYQSTHAIDGPLGFGWTSSLMTRLYYATYLFSAPATYQKEVIVTMPSGARYIYLDTGSGTFAAPVGRHDTLIGNPDGTFDLTPQRTRQTYHFGPDGRIQAFTDEFGNTLTMTYDGSGRLQSSADAAGSGRFLNVFWGADGRISALQDSTGRQVQYSYNAQGALASVTDPASRVLTYAYTPGRFSPLLTRITDNWGRVVTTITYDTAGRVASYTEGGELYTYTYAYQGNRSVTAKTDSTGNTYIFPFSAAGLVTATTPPSGGGGVSHTDYYADGSIQQATDATGVKTYYTYTTTGALLSVTRDYQGANSVRWDHTYDPLFPDKLTSIIPHNPSTNYVDPNWQGWRYDYYQIGSVAPGALFHAYRLRDDGTTADTMATYEYDARGRVTTATNGVGSQWLFSYDAAGNLAQLSAPPNNSAGIRPVYTYGYDSLGRVTSTTDPLGNITTCTYDPLDRVTTVTVPKPIAGAPATYTVTTHFDRYDSGTGLLFVDTIDPNGVQTSQGFDQFGRPVRAVDGLGAASTYQYSHGLVSGMTDGNGNTTTFSYDTGRRLVGTTYPDGQTELYTYTADGRIAQRTDRRGQTIHYAYDSLKRLTSGTYPSSALVIYVWAGEKLVSVTDGTTSPAETHSYAYDAAFRRISDTQYSRGTLTYTYNADNTIASITAQSGPTRTYAYFADGSVSATTWSAISGTFAYGYTLAGKLSSVLFPNAQHRDYQYDDQGRLLQIATLTGGNSTIAAFAYGYDVNQTSGALDRLGHRVTAGVSLPAQGLANAVTKYDYDSASRLTKATYPAAAPYNSRIESWTYDALGNRLSSTINGTPQTYTYQKIGANPNAWVRLTSDPTGAYTHDANGSVTSIAGQGFTWNADNRMATATGAIAAAYAYDFMGRRTQKTTGGVTATYLYDGIRVIRETASATTDYLYGPGSDAPLAAVRAGQVYYYAPDGLDSIAAVNDPAGNIQVSTVYGAWGQTLAQTGTFADTLGYTGREQDIAGLLFYRSRFYSPGTGRFLSTDPLEHQHKALPSQLLYTYTGNQPAEYSDPTGMERTCDLAEWRTKDLYDAQFWHSPIDLIHVDYFPALTSPSAPSLGAGGPTGQGWPGNPTIGRNTGASAAAAAAANTWAQSCVWQRNSVWTGYYHAKQWNQQRCRDTCTGKYWDETPTYTAFDLTEVKRTTETWNTWSFTLLGPCNRPGEAE